jgi:tRNA A-37 threonylcarbamoyl transferase component Bud32
VAYLEVNPRYRELVERYGLFSPEDFLDLPAEIISGHPGRHVRRVRLDAGVDRFGAFLKREHRVAWKDRVLNALAGYGFISKSHREMLTLRELARSPIHYPDWVAVGEDRRGRAFLLVREIADGQDLGLFLRERESTQAGYRLPFARTLGEALAQLHDAGLVHGDLYAKHVLVRSTDSAIFFLDWQRSQRHRSLSWQRRCHDLAALNATLADSLASFRERLACLRSYLRTSRGLAPRRSLRPVLERILRHTKYLLGQRRIREQRRMSVAPVSQHLIWKDGEALCLTAEFHASLQNQMPDWLLLDCLPQLPTRLKLRQVVDLLETQQGLLIQCRSQHVFRSIWKRLCGKTLVSAELRQAALHFRLQRCGVPNPKLLAFGQREIGYGTVESFVLTELLSDTISVADWHGANVTGAHRRRWLIRELAGCLRQLHRANCFLARRHSRYDADKDRIWPLAIQQVGHDAPVVVLSDLAGVVAKRRPSQCHCRRDLKALRASLSWLFVSQTDTLRFLLGYLGVKRLPQEAKALASTLIQRNPCLPRTQVRPRGLPYRSLPLVDQGVLS